MKASNISESIQTLAPTGQPLFLWGPPGVGKSQVVKATARAMGIDLIDVRAILLDPVDLRGLPRISPEGLSQWCTPDFLPRQGQGILFLDELNAAPPLVQAACYQLVLDRRLGEYELPEGWTVIAAGNRETDRAVTHRMPSALANRFVHIDFSVDLDEWIDWAIGAAIAPEVIAFLRFRPTLLHSFDPETNTKAFPTPRSWEFVSNLVTAVPAPHLFHELTQGTVGKGAAAEFAGFIKIWKELPPAREILDHPNAIDIPKDPAILFAMCEMLGHAVTGTDMEAMVQFGSRLPAEFGVLLMREAVRNKTALLHTPAFAEWAKNNCDVLV